MVCLKLGRLHRNGERMKIIRPFVITDASLVACNVPENDYAVWTSGTTYALADKVIVANKASNVTITIASPGVVTWTAHSLAANTVVIFKTTSALPTGITANKAYYVRNPAANTFEISLTSGGASINTTGAQSGTHSCQAMISPVSSTVTMTTATPTVVTWTGHGFFDDQKVMFYTTGTLPTGITSNVPYYIVKATTDTFQISSSAGGASLAVTGAGSGTHFAIAQIHKIFESLSAGNLGNAPHKNTYNADTNPTGSWLDTGADNRWNMFDTSITSQTSNPDSIVCWIKTTGRVDAAALLNVRASQVVITAYDGGGSIVYGPNTYSLVDTTAIGDWWTYFFEPIAFTNDWVDIDFPPYADLLLKIELNNTGQSVLCGGLIVGLSKHLGAIQYGANLGILDYSVKQRDAFGNYNVLERAFSKRGRFTLWVDASLVDSVITTLTQYRAIPCVYVGPTDYHTSIIYGFYKDFNVDIAYPTMSLCSLDVEGLT